MSRHFGGSPVRQTDKARVLLFLSFSFLVLFGALAFLYLKPAGESTPSTVVIEREQAPEMMDVLIPLRNISSGMQLQRAMFKTERRPANTVVAGTVRRFEEVLGHYARTTIVKDIPLHSELVTDVRPTTAISSAIPPGHRAVTIRVNATSSVEGWASPGSKVDVVWASQIRGQPGITVIVQNAKVLSAERQVQPQNGQPGTATAAPGPEGEKAMPNTVTLLVSAKDAQKIELAKTTGSISLALRGDADTGKADVGGSITINDLLGTKTEKAALPQTKGTVIMGGKKWYVAENGELVPLDQAGGQGQQASDSDEDQ